MIRTATLVIAWLVAALGSAAADEAPSADRHAKGSATLYLGSMWSPGPTVPIRIGVEGALRLHAGHLAIETRFGAGGSGSVTAFSSLFGAHLGGSVGFAFALGNRLTFSPMIGYDVFGLWEKEGATFAVHYATLQLPLAILIARRVVLEPHVQLGFARFHGATDPVVIVGPRIGIVL